MKYFIQLGGGIKGPFTIEELREFNITPTTRVCPEGQGNVTDDQPSYTKAEKFEELAQLFTNSEPNIPSPIFHPEIPEKGNDIKSAQGVSIEPKEVIKITPKPPIETKGVNPRLPKIKTILVYAVGVLLVILSVAYWLTKKPPFPPPISGSASNILVNVLPEITDCKAKSDSLLKIGEQNIEQSNGESLTAFRLMKDYKNCADKGRIEQLKIKFRSQMTTDEAIINDPDIQKRNTQFRDAIKLLDEIITPNQ